MMGTYIIVKVWENEKYLCSVKLNSFQELHHWIINHLDLSIYEASGYRFECYF